MALISFGALPCRKKKTWWQLASRCCWNRACPWLGSEFVSFLVGLRTYRHPCPISYILTTSRRELSLSFFFLQGKAPKEIHAILTETLACFLPVRAKDLSAPLYYIIHFNNIETRAVIKFFFPARQGAEGNSRNSDKNISLFPSWSG